jgi:hypothetical protein
MVKPFLRLKGTRYVSPTVCQCSVCMGLDHPMRIRFFEQDGWVRAYAVECVNGTTYWWLYANYLPMASVSPSLLSS